MLTHKPFWLWAGLYLPGSESRTPFLARASFHSPSYLSRPDVWPLKHLELETLSGGGWHQVPRNLSLSFLLFSCPGFCSSRSNSSILKPYSSSQPRIVNPEASGHFAMVFTRYFFSPNSILLSTQEGVCRCGLCRDAATRLHSPGKLRHPVNPSLHSILPWGLYTGCFLCLECSSPRCHMPGSCSLRSLPKRHLF